MYIEGGKHTLLVIFHSFLTINVCFIAGYWSIRCIHTGDKLRRIYWRVSLFFFLLSSITSLLISLVIYTQTPTNTHRHTHPPCPLRNTSELLSHAGLVSGVFHQCEQRGIHKLHTSLLVSKATAICCLGRSVCVHALNIGVLEFGLWNDVTVVLEHPNTKVLKLGKKDNSNKMYKDNLTCSGGLRIFIGISCRFGLQCYFGSHLGHVIFTFLTIELQKKFLRLYIYFPFSVKVRPFVFYRRSHTRR